MNQSEITLRAIFISILLTVVLAASNTYLALKIGILPSASIPAAMISMGILRFFPNANVLENNLIQTAASAGQAVVGGIVYTAPSLIMIHYWQDFPYWQCCMMAFLGGTLGVLFSIPIRKKLVTDPALPFPEGKAIAAVLQSGENNQHSVRKMVMGGVIGALIDLFQSGFKILAENVHYWVVSGKTIFGFESGFSIAMLGTGYLIGINIGASLLVGGILGWGIGMPALSSLLDVAQVGSSTDIAMNFWNTKLRYISIGAMLFAGVFSLSVYAKSFMGKIFFTLKLLLTHKKIYKTQAPATEKDMPSKIVLLGIGITLIGLYLLFNRMFDLNALVATSPFQTTMILVFFVLYVLIAGFLFSAICGYFSGLVGVSGAPGSGIIVSGALFIALLFQCYLKMNSTMTVPNTSLLQAQAIIIIVTAIVGCISAIACDNIQDLKVGYIVGSTPWKQQLMLLLGILIVAIVAPIIMQLLFSVYGLAGAERPGVSQAQALSAPPAAMIASLTDAVFKNNIPWSLIAFGAFIILVIILLRYFLTKNRLKFSILAVATGMYLPLSVTMPLFVGSLASELIKRRLKRDKSISPLMQETRYQRGFLIACGLLSGAALMQVALAAIFAGFHNSEILRIMPEGLSFLSNVLSLSCLGGVVWWMYRVV